MKIFLGRYMNLEGAIEFAKEINSLSPQTQYDFDFSILEWVEPFSLLYLSFAINHFCELHKDAEIFVSNYDNSAACNYAGHMGFYKAFHVDIGKSPGEASGSINYIPVRIFNIEEWQKEANKQKKPLAEIIENISRKLARVLTRQRQGDLIDTLEFIIREIVRNVAEHSKAIQVGFCAQYWPTKNKVELAILDSGRGFKESLSKNPYLDKNMTDHDAINYALLPGISGRMFKGITKDPYDVWENSGFGLYMASEICRNGGSFFACSNSSGMLLEENTKRNFTLETPCTAIRLILNTSKIDPVSKSLPQYHKKGEDIAKKINGANIKASVASTMLTRDFK